MLHITKLFAIAALITAGLIASKATSEARPAPQQGQYEAR